MRALRRHAIRYLLAGLVIAGLAVTSFATTRASKVMAEPAGYGYGYGPEVAGPAVTATTTSTTTTTLGSGGGGPETLGKCPLSGAIDLFLCQAYLDMFGRLPDVSGLGTWGGQLSATQLVNGMPPLPALAMVAMEMQTSPTLEWYGVLVNSWYHRFLNRKPDAAGFPLWVQLLVHGTVDEQAMADMAASGEAFGNAGNSNATWVQNLYHEILGRSADPTSLAAWVAQLTATTNPAAVNQRIAVALAILRSNEYRNNLITVYYAQFLGRTADPGGRAAALAFLTAGATDEQLIQALIGSNEFWHLATGT